MWPFRKKQEPIPKARKRPEPTPQQLRNERDAAVEAAVYRQEMAYAALGCANEHKNDTIKMCLLDEAADANRLMDELSEVQERKTKLLALRDGDKATAEPA